jgi:hypothetical protein
MAIRLNRDKKIKKIIIFKKKLKKDLTAKKKSCIFVP